MPPTCPWLLRASAALFVAPPRLPRSIARPPRQSTACAPTANPTDPHGPDPPTASPFSLISIAALAVSPAIGGSRWLTNVAPLGPNAQSTPSKSKTCGAAQLESCTPFSATPTTWCWLLAPNAQELFPPGRGGSGIISLVSFRQRNPLQI